MGLLNNQQDASEKYKSEYFKHYEDAINDKKKLVDYYMWPQTVDNTRI